MSSSIDYPGFNLVTSIAITWEMLRNTSMSPQPMGWARPGEEKPTPTPTPQRQRKAKPKPKAKAAKAKRNWKAKLPNKAKPKPKAKAKQRQRQMDDFAKCQDATQSSNPTGIDIVENGNDLHMNAKPTIQTRWERLSPKAKQMQRRQVKDASGRLES